MNRNRKARLADRAGRATYCHRTRRERTEQGFISWAQFDGECLKRHKERSTVRIISIPAEIHRENKKAAPYLLT